MARILNSCVVWIGAMGLTASPLVPLAGQVVGINAAVRNDVKVKQTRTSAAEQAKRGQHVKLRNQITTGKSSSVQIALLDRTTITVGPDARLTVDKFVYDPDRKSSSVGANIAKGTFRFLSGKPAHGGTNSLDTPAATIGIRGTMLEGAVGEDAIAIVRLQPGFMLPADTDPATATLVVLRGPGPHAPASERRGEIGVNAGGSALVLNLPGQAVFIPRAGAAPIPLSLGPQAYQYFDLLLRTAPDSFNYAAALLHGPADSQAGGNLPGVNRGTGRRGRQSGIQIGMLVPLVFAGILPLVERNGRSSPPGSNGT